MTATVTVSRPTAIQRTYWATIVNSTCLRHAALLRIIDWAEPGAHDLEKLPTAIHTVVFTKCQELIARACRSEAKGKSAHSIEQLANAELWNFLKTWRRDAASDTENNTGVKHDSE